MLLALTPLSSAGPYDMDVSLNAEAGLVSKSPSREYTFDSLAVDLRKFLAESVCLVHFSAR